MSSKDCLYKSGVEKQILIALHERVSMLIAGSPVSPFDWVQAVQVLDNSLSAEDDSTLYDLADRGIIRVVKQASMKELGFCESSHLHGS